MEMGRERWGFNEHLDLELTGILSLSMYI